MKDILFLIRNDHNLILSEDQKRMLKVKLESYKSEDIIKVIKNYSFDRKKFIFDDIIKEDVFNKYLNFNPDKRQLPDYLDKLDKEAKNNLMDCHNEIMLKCCSRSNYIYELLIEKLFKYFTEDKIPFWCMSGVLYHDILIDTPVAPIKVVAEMNKRDNFIYLCRAQYKRVSISKKNKLHVNLFANVKELKNENVNEQRERFLNPDKFSEQNCNF